MTNFRATKRNCYRCTITRATIVKTTGGWRFAAVDIRGTHSYHRTFDGAVAAAEEHFSSRSAS